jgi:hypothetical protein
MDEVELFFLRIKLLLDIEIEKSGDMFDPKILKNSIQILKTKTKAETFSSILKTVKLYIDRDLSLSPEVKIKLNHILISCVPETEVNDFLQNSFFGERGSPGDEGEEGVLSVFTCQDGDLESCLPCTLPLTAGDGKFIDMADAMVEETLGGAKKMDEIRLDQNDYQHFVKKKSYRIRRRSSLPRAPSP